ncbi:unnamed protein product [Amoebophrya sp. A120]|nr:unnamed protein product [Amoebophrya sp. A120]|eukprot:GSA120T00006102001.1
MRKLKYHEKKLLKKTNFYDWKSDDTTRESSIIRRYQIQDRDDYAKYNKIAGLVTKLTAQLRKLPSDDAERIKMTELLLEKLFAMGLTQSRQSLTLTEKLPASVFCRRRLPVIMVETKMAENLTNAIELIEHGHVRIGPDRVTNSALHVTRDMQDHITWAEGSKIKRHVQAYSGVEDDYELLRN